MIYQRSVVLTSEGIYDYAIGINWIFCVINPSYASNYSINLKKVNLPAILLAKNNKVFVLSIRSKDFIKTQFNLSQEEIDALMQELENAKIQAGNGYAPLPPSDTNGNTFEGSPSDPWFYGSNYTPNKDKAKCFHKWKLYTGLVEQFEYCEICNEKKK